MQFTEIIFIIGNIAWLIFGTLCGGLITKLVIRALEINERERQGDFLSLMYLGLAKDQMQMAETGNIAVILSRKWRSRTENVANGLIQAAATCQKKYRDKLYNIARRMTKTKVKDTSLYISSNEIGSVIEEMESHHFGSPIDTEQ